MTLAFSDAELPGPFGREVFDININRLGDDDLRQLLNILYHHRFLVIRTGGLSKQDYVAFAKRMGEPIQLSQDESYPEIAIMNNKSVNTAKEKRGAAHWHSDQSFRKQRASITMLYCSSAPQEGGETRFCDLAGAYASLPDDIKAQIEDLVVIHRHGVSVAARPGDHVPIPPKNWDQSREVYHPLVMRHPVTNEKTLYAISGTSQGIVGMDPGKATALLRTLCDHAFQDQFVTSHRHSNQDITMWDNPTTMHSASPIRAATIDADTREVLRISLRGAAPVFETGQV
jgi:taurine dioxygenase